MPPTTARPSQSMIFVSQPGVTRRRASGVLTQSAARTRSSTSSARPASSRTQAPTLPHHSGKRLATSPLRSTSPTKARRGTHMSERKNPTPEHPALPAVRRLVRELQSDADFAAGRTAFCRNLNRDSPRCEGFEAEAAKLSKAVELVEGVAAALNEKSGHR